MGGEVDIKADGQFVQENKHSTTTYARTSLVSVLNDLDNSCGGPSDGIRRSAIK